MNRVFKKAVWYQHWSAKHKPTQRDRVWCCNKLCIFFFVIVVFICLKKKKEQKYAAVSPTYKTWLNGTASLFLHRERVVWLKDTLFRYIIQFPWWQFHVTSSLDTHLSPLGRQERTGRLTFPGVILSPRDSQGCQSHQVSNPRGALVKSNVAPSLSFSPPNGEQTVEVEEQTRTGGIEEELAGSFFQRYESNKDREGTKIQLPSKFTSYTSWVVSGD